MPASRAPRQAERRARWAGAAVRPTGSPPARGLKQRGMQQSIRSARVWESQAMRAVLLKGCVIQHANGQPLMVEFAMAYGSLTIGFRRHLNPMVVSLSSHELTEEDAGGAGGEVHAGRHVVRVVARAQPTRDQACAGSIVIVPSSARSRSRLCLGDCLSCTLHASHMTLCGPTRPEHG